MVAFGFEKGHGSVDAVPLEEDEAVLEGAAGGAGVFEPAG
jgi:hypothetical protein